MPRNARITSIKKSELTEIKGSFKAKKKQKLKEEKSARKKREEDDEDAMRYDQMVNAADMRGVTRGDEVRDEKDAPSIAGTEDLIGACAPEPRPRREHQGNIRGAKECVRTFQDGYIFTYQEPGFARNIAKYRVSPPQARAVPV